MYAVAFVQSSVTSLNPFVHLTVLNKINLFSMKRANTFTLLTYSCECKVLTYIPFLQEDDWKVLKAGTYEDQVDPREGGGGWGDRRE